MHNSFPRVDVSATTVYEQLRAPFGISETQRSNIPQLLQLVDEDLADCAIEISRLESRLSFLKSHRERLDNHKSLLQSLQSPIHCLPNELLSRILLHASGVNHLGRRDSQSTMTLSFVCSRWRNLTMCCSELWSTFSVNLCKEDEFDEKTNGKLEAVLNCYLERSRSRLLQLTIDSPPWREGSEHPLLGKLLRCSTRWQNLELIVDRLSSMLYPSLQGLDLPALESLEIDQTENDGLGDLGTFALAPKLRTLCAEWELRMPSAISNQITTLEYEAYTDFYEMLALCPNLQTLRIRSDGDGELVDFKDPPYLLSITSLSVIICRYDMKRTVISSLTAPKLDTLVLKQASEWKDNHGRVKSAFSAIDLFLARSSCQLTTLEINELSITDQQLVHLLKRLPSLEKLTVQDPVYTKLRSLPISRAFIESLHSHRQSRLHASLNPMLPRLRALTLRVRSKKFDHKSLISTVSSRWIPDQSYTSQIGISCLRSVELFLLEAVNQTDYEPLAHFETSGMRVVVRQSREEETKDCLCFRC